MATEREWLEDPKNRECAKCNTCQFRLVMWKLHDFIKEGGLKEDPDVSQVNKTAWIHLSRIVKNGFLTFDSQDAYDNPDERAYVCGFLMTDRALDFVHKINMYTDKVALVLLPVSKSQVSSITVTRNHRRNAESYHSETRIHLYSTKKEIDFLKTSVVGIPKRINVSMVAVFDPVWGRPARSKHGLFGEILSAFDRLEEEWEEKICKRITEGADRSTGC